MLSYYCHYHAAYCPYLTWEHSDRFCTHNVWIHSEKMVCMKAAPRLAPVETIVSWKCMYASITCRTVQYFTKKVLFEVIRLSSFSLEMNVNIINQCERIRQNIRPYWALLADLSYSICIFHLMKVVLLYVFMTFVMSFEGTIPIKLWWIGVYIWNEAVFHHVPVSYLIIPQISEMSL